MKIEISDFFFYLEKRRCFVWISFFVLMSKEDFRCLLAYFVYKKKNGRTLITHGDVFLFHFYRYILTSRPAGLWVIFFYSLLPLHLLLHPVMLHFCVVLDFISPPASGSTNSSSSKYTTDKNHPWNCIILSFLRPVLYFPPIQSHLSLYSSNLHPYFSLSHPSSNNEVIFDSSSI